MIEASTLPTFGAIFKEPSDAVTETIGPPEPPAFHACQLALSETNQTDCPLVNCSVVALLTVEPTGKRLTAPLPTFLMNTLNG